MGIAKVIKIGTEKVSQVATGSNNMKVTLNNAYAPLLHLHLLNMLVPLSRKLK